ncbi:hypothetical protein D9M68_938790 [compost metagenome]
MASSVFFSSRPMVNMAMLHAHKVKALIVDIWLNIRTLSGLLLVFETLTRINDDQPIAVK